jgi:putative membrane protein
MGWNWDPLVLVSLALMALIYGRGLRSLWRSAGRGRGTPTWRAVAFFGGWLALIVALVSPLESWSQRLFSMHMVQHVILTMVAAPLIAWSEPTVTGLWALPTEWRRGISQWWRSPWEGIWQRLTHPAVVWLLYAGVITLWHLPILYQAAAQNALIHNLEHISFFAIAFLFWRTVVRCGRPGEMGHGLGILFIFTAMLYSAVFAAAITFSRSPWYPYYAFQALQWGMSPLEDQQLAGSIMWIPGKLVHLVGVMALMLDWFKQMDRQEQRRQIVDGEIAATHANPNKSTAQPSPR